MKPRGVTLVELLAAISILVVVTALSMPAISSRLGAARLDAAQGQIQAAVLANRAEAMRLGRPVVLEARVASGEVQLTVNTLSEASAAGEPAGESAATSSKPRAGVEAQVWATLGGGLRIAEHPEAAVKGESTAARGGRWADPVRIAVFCPDGTAIAAGPTYLSDAETTLSVTVNQWIGGVAFAPYSAEAAESSEQPEERPADSGSPGRDERKEPR